LAPGWLLLAVARWRARSAAGWLPIAWAVLTVGQSGIQSSRILDFWQVATITVFVLVAWFLRRTAVSAR
jgi:hypothetical protein